MRKFIHILVGTFMALSSAHARADIYVVVNKSNPVHSLTQKEVVNIFMGRTHAFAGGDYVRAFDLPRDSGAHEQFYQLLIGMTVAQVNTYWARLIFTGQTLQPKALDNEDAMIETVRRNPGAIGYLTQEPLDKDVQVVLVLKTGQDHN